MVQTICIMLEVDDVRGRERTEGKRGRRLKRGERESWVTKVIPRTDASSRQQSKESARFPLHSFTSVPRNLEEGGEVGD